MWYDDDSVQVADYFYKTWEETELVQFPNGTVVPTQGIGESNAARLQIAISERAVGVDEGDLVAQAARHVGVDEIGHGIMGAALAEIVVHASPPCQPSNNRVSSRRASTPATRRR